ncbi:GTP:adenosylcobinamide-phosphateguanylyl transferase-like protein [Haloterrigena turkmenica DSM 5511]|uniref:GTP:adenosylcobinamide-phosphateguanylyl transferase-like protein n=1 Tax=Haloterrigena turkmenica (strain ATCC 51198 / DSM 5511 / JCM 9101 / NCIMB 13204 / VKM B-1734 / 4k) TaxID=543526 RepID=D2RXI2_HALTV|nr:GTP--adenosylcobinamide-phosphate guanylyl transferase [Haloterrigena turkmenica]ADB61706.1 GTP:adenosylcobinamide-phosphateguanylyl transferase-like protein [Haloterrigena turkmenica DSM 5511]
MCGGKGTRLESPREKPLHPIDGVAMVDRVLDGLEESRVDAVYAAVSPNAPETRTHLEAIDGVTTIETAGDGYVADLMALLERSDIEPPILTVAADVPLLAGAAVDRVLAAHGDATDGDGSAAPSLTVAVPVALKRRLGVSVDATLESDDHLAPTGVNVVGDSDESMSMTHVSYDPRLAINVNRREDARIAAARLSAASTEDR